MKKFYLISALVFCFVMLFAANSIAALDITEEEAKALESVSSEFFCYSAGDCDGNGIVTAEDARICLRNAVSLEKLEAIAIERADIDGDGKITAADARAILRLAVGLDEPCGHNTEEFVIIPATCKTSGYSIHYCKICLKKYSEETTSPINHVAIWMTTVEPTCQEEGKAEFKCILCDTVLDEKVREKSGHSYGEWVYPNGIDCYEPCERYRVCTVCEHRQDDIENPPAVHNFIWIDTVKKTCTENGLREYTCQRCGLVQDSQVIKANGHFYFENSAIVEATCTEDGIRGVKCVWCDGVKEGTESVIPATGHNFDEKNYRVQTEPTCSREGSALVFCKNCGVSKEISLEKKAHTYTTAPVVTVKPTCTTEGQTSCVCKYCGTITESVAATGHTLTTAVEREATCAEEGIRRTKCSDCDFYSDEAIAKLPHDYDKKNPVIVEAATCSTTGTAKYICKNCGDESTYELAIKPTAHKESAPVIIKEATCTTNAVGRYTCVYCSENLGDKTIKASATGHTPGNIVTREAACEVKGYVKTYCANCGELYDTQYTPALTHTMKWVVTTEPTCGTSGRNSYICTICNKVSSYHSILATGEHKSSGEWVVTREATCTKDGTKAIKCSVCDTILEKGVIKASHNYDTDITIIKNPTCTDDGFMAAKCLNNCGEYDKTTLVSIPATGHNFDGEAKVIINATCTDAGLIAVECSNGCGTLSEDTKVEIPATGHTEGEWVITEPTCTENGSKVMSCTACGDVIETIVIDATGHTAGELIVSFTADGSGHRTCYCQVCGEVISDEAFTRVAVVKDPDITVEFVSGTDFENGPISFTVTSEKTIAEVDYILPDDSVAQVINARNGVYTINLPDGVSKAGTITIRIAVEFEE